MSTLNVNNVPVKEILSMMNRDETSHIIHPFGENYQRVVNSDFKDDEIDLLPISNELDERKKSIEIQGKTLISAVINRDTKFVEQLLNNHNIKDYINYMDCNGFTAANYAVSSGWNEIYDLLIDAGADRDNKKIEDFLSFNRLKKDEMENISFKDDIETLHVDEFKEKEKKSVVTPAFTFKKGFLNSKSKKVQSNSTESIKVVNITGEDGKPLTIKTNGFKKGFLLDDDKKSSENKTVCISNVDVIDPYEKIHRIPFESKFVNEKISEIYEQNIKVKPNLNLSGNYVDEIEEDENSDKTKIYVTEGKSTGEYSGDNSKDFLPFEHKHEGFNNEVTPEMLQQFLPKPYNQLHIEYLNMYANRDVTKLLLAPNKIPDSIAEHRRIMLQGTPNLENLNRLIKNVLLQQDGSIKKSEIEKLSKETYETIVLYRDIYMRLIDIDKVYVKNSPIHGKGVFASKDIKKGTIITFYFPYFIEIVHNKNNKESYVIIPILSRRKFDEKTNNLLDALRQGTIKVAENMMLIGDDEFYSDSRFLGHMVNDPCDFSERKPTYEEYDLEVSFKANASVIPYDGDRRFTYLVSTKDIEKDEEILVPYGCSFWEI